jgi:beta-glucosidase
VPVPRLNIPSIRLSDGPNGVRGTCFFDAVPSTCLPCGTGLGATFDKDLLRRVGGLLADECRAKGAHMLLGPTINIPRAPLGGRGFESYSEDPYLAGILAGYYCEGVQSRGIVACLKHFACNDQEDQRMAFNAIVTERALREIYLAPFQTALKHCQAGAIMTAYNQINGTHAAENEHILKDILRGEWAWNGLVTSDWFGTYSTTGAIKAGLDLEMPGPTRWRGEALLHAITANKVKKSELNDRVRAVLRLVNSGIRSGIPENAPELRLDRPEDRALAREVAAQSQVLLKNEANILPFNKEKRIAVIGPNSKIATISGGGSASLTPYYTVTPYEGITAKAVAGVDWAQGVYSHQSLPTIGGFMRTHHGREGFTVKMYNDPPEAQHRQVLEERVLTDSNVLFAGFDRQGLADIWHADAEGIFTAPESGLYDFGLAVDGTARLYIDDELVVDNVENQRAGSTFIGCGTVEETGTKELVEAQQYKVFVRWASTKSSTRPKPDGVVTFGHGGFRIAGCKRLDFETSIKEAAELARSVDQVVLFTGLSGEWESEGQDRPHMNLPFGNDDLIRAVLDANPNAVIVVQSGTPVAMPWADKAKAIVQAWFGGNETGNGIADVLYGDVNPSGKLPLTMPRRVQDNPAYINYRCEGGRTLYGEDIYVGYRWYENVEITPLFPFGHGLSYTSFETSDLQVTQNESSSLNITCQVTNIGTRAGAHVIQVYIAAPESQYVGRPVKELKCFSKVFLEAGETKKVDVAVDLVRATSYWDENENKWCSEAGTYKIMVGDSSAAVDFLTADFTVEKTANWSGL